MALGTETGSTMVRGAGRSSADEAGMASKWLGLAGKTALVTGGASGIGLAIARGFLQAGAAVEFIDRNPQSEDVAQQQFKDGPRRRSGPRPGGGHRDLSVTPHSTSDRPTA